MNANTVSNNGVDKPEGFDHSRQAARTRLRPVRWLGIIVLVLLILLSLFLASTAIWYNASLPGISSKLIVSAFLICSVAFFLFMRPVKRALLAYAALLTGVFLWWSLLEPRMNRDWAPEYAHPPRAEVDGDTITFHNVRNNIYKSPTEFTPQWETRSYDLNKLQGIDLFLSYWDSPHIAHTIMSWDFGEDGHLAISIETRRESHESYSAVAGFFRQYELYYVVADERDLVGVRTNYRGEDVYLYRLRLPVEKAREGLLDYVRSINELSVKPKWYNALTQNCTSTIRMHAEQIGTEQPWNWRLLVNGHLDEMGYMNHSINTSAPFEVIRERSNINDEAIEAGIVPDFSRQIRIDLPKRPARE